MLWLPNIFTVEVYKGIMEFYKKLQENDPGLQENDHGILQKNYRKWIVEFCKGIIGK